MVVRGPNAEGFEMDDALVRRLCDLARRGGRSPDAVLRAALDDYEQRHAMMNAPPQPTDAPAESVYEILEREGLIGCLDGLPPDLSTNPRYMEGFGQGSGCG